MTAAAFAVQQGMHSYQHDHVLLRYSEIVTVMPTLMIRIIAELAALLTCHQVLPPHINLTFIYLLSISVKDGSHKRQSLYVQGASPQNIHSTYKLHIHTHKTKQINIHR